MSEFGGLCKHWEKKKKRTACTVGWLARLCCSWLSPGKATRITRERNPNGTFFFHVEEEILHIQNCSSMFPRDHSTPSACTQTGKIIILIFPVNHAAIRRRGGMTLGPHRPQTISHRVLRRKRSAGLVMVLWVRINFLVIFMLKHWPLKSNSSLPSLRGKSRHASWLKKDKTDR